MSLVSETVKADDEGEEEEEEQRYCVCRGTYGNKFMIGCDNCEEWFHGSCISINSDQAKYVDKYYCPFCKGEENVSSYYSSISFLLVFSVVNFLHR